MMSKQSQALILCFGLILGGCAMGNREGIRTEPHVDLQRYMGDWYVIANIPTSAEKGAHNAVESYALNDDGTIATTFTFNKDSFDGKQKKYTPKGFVRDKRTNAIWGMRLIWPFKSDYRIVYLNSDYSRTIVGRLKRDYVWIMARTPVVSESDYQKLVRIVGEEGYDTSKIKKVPQQPQ